MWALAGEAECAAPCKVPPWRPGLPELACVACTLWIRVPATAVTSIACTAATAFFGSATLLKDCELFDCHTVLSYTVCWCGATGIVSGVVLCYVGLAGLGRVRALPPEGMPGCAIMCCGGTSCCAWQLLGVHGCIPSQCPASLSSCLSSSVLRCGLFLGRCSAARLAASCSM